MEKQVQELLKKLNIDYPVEKQGEYWVATLDTYEDFVSIYNKLEKSLDVFKNSHASFFNEEDGHIQYETDDGFILELVAVLDEDDYTLNIYNDEEED